MAVSRQDDIDLYGEDEGNRRHDSRFNAEDFGQAAEKVGKGIGGVFTDAWSALRGDVGYEPSNTYISSDPAVAGNIPALHEGGVRIDESRDALRSQVMRPGYGLTKNLYAAATGREGAPSAAQAQLDAANSQAMRQQLAMAAGTRGGAAQQAAAQRAAMMNQGAMTQASARESAALRAREQQAAQQQLAQHLGTQGGMQLQQQRADFELAKQNQDALLRRQEMKMGAARQEAGSLGSMAMGAVTALGTAVSDVRGKEDIAPAFTWDSDINAQREAYNPMNQRPEAAAGGGGGDGGGGLGGIISGILSDRASKQEISRLRGALETLGAANEEEIDKLSGAQYPSQDEMRRSLEVLSTPEGSRRGLAPVEPYQYRYKPEIAQRYGEDTSPRVGVMAQDMAESPYLQNAVEKGPDGMLRIDGNRGLSTALAAAAGLDKRLKDVEARQPGTLTPEEEDRLRGGQGLRDLQAAAGAR